MNPDVAVQYARETLMMALLLAVPVLAVATVVSLMISIGQVMTSIQEQTVATVPRLIVVVITTIVLMPWMLRKLMGFTIRMLADFHRCLG
jgi:flagellar biosynthetic protein FliQ